MICFLGIAYTTIYKKLKYLIKALCVCYLYKKKYLKFFICICSKADSITISVIRPSPVKEPLTTHPSIQKGLSENHFGEGIWLKKANEENIKKGNK